MFNVFSLSAGFCCRSPQMLSHVWLKFAAHAKPFTHIVGGDGLILAECFAVSTQEQMAALMQQQMQQESQFLAAMHQFTRQMQQVHEAGVGSAPPSHPEQAGLRSAKIFDLRHLKNTTLRWQRRRNMTIGSSASSEPFVRQIVTHTRHW